MKQMSVISKNKPVTLQSLQRKKQKGEKIVALTAYDYTTARLLDDAGVDFLLVGDSLAMTILGHPNTLSVTVDEMIHHVKAVVRGTRRAMVLADMPFMSYTTDHASAIRNAGRFIQEGQCAGIKLEGAHPQVLGVIEHLTRIGIPVMGHLGFTPQSVNTLGGFKVQGKTVEDAERMLEEARMLEAVGAFAVVLEMVPAEVARIITRELSIPTIGIGSGNGCDGQILVIDDMLGRYPDLSPRFVRKYMDSATLVKDAVRQYAEDIQSGDFPRAETESFHFPAELIEELESRLCDDHARDPHKRTIKRVI
jgi:3-methyl-2-oxobutanoate hydroxymethyltransferase